LIFRRWICLLLRTRHWECRLTFSWLKFGDDLSPNFARLWRKVDKRSSGSILGDLSPNLTRQLEKGSLNFSWLNFGDDLSPNFAQFWRKVDKRSSGSILDIYLLILPDSWRKGSFGSILEILSCNPTTTFGYLTLSTLTR